MNDLRLIILAIGLCIIVFIYLWEIGKQRRQHRRETINYSPPDSDNYDLKIKPVRGPEPDYSLVLSDLNEALNKTRQQEDEDISRILKSELKAELIHEPAGSGITKVPFVMEDGDKSDGQNKAFAGDYEDIGEEHIINLYVTAGEGKLFSGGEIQDAAYKIGLEFGELNIFHNFRIGDSRMARPLYSIADMYEPGNFDPDNMGSRNTRGLTLFMCLPGVADGERVFELMLNSARKLAAILSGEVRGPDRQLLNESHIRSILRLVRGG